MPLSCQVGSQSFGASLIVNDKSVGWIKMAGIQNATAVGDEGNLLVHRVGIISDTRCLEGGIEAFL